jgi:two-component system OmpR family sensor kinase
VAVGAGLWAAFRTGLLDDGTVSASALRSDWVLIAGALIALLAVAVLLPVTAGRRRERRLLAEQAAAGARERRLFLSRLDHELKNPLTAMRAALANVAADASGAGRRAGVARIESQLVQLSRLTANLRKIAEVGSGHLERRPVDVAALLEEVVHVARERPPAADRELSLDLPRGPGPLPEVDGDEDLLSLAVLNVVENAVKYTEAGDRIEVRARAASGRVVVEVADTGSGIHPEDLAHIWEELYRSPRTRAVPGSGLGLALVRAVVERHGGGVAVESRPERGTVVRVLLPCGVPGGMQKVRRPAGVGRITARRNPRRRRSGR